MPDDEKTRMFFAENEGDENFRRKQSTESSQTRIWKTSSESRSVDADKTVFLNKQQQSNQLAWLVAFKGKRHIGKFDLTGEDYLIGRASYCDIQLDDEESELSKLHGRIRYDETSRQFIYTDCGSANGSKINGKDVTRKELDDNDRIAIGPFELVFKKV